jgi:hypothetical protein
MTDAEVLAAIKANHLEANIGCHERGETDGVPRWEQAWIDPGGVLWGPGPYAKVPIDFGHPDWNTVVRVYPPERLRKRLAAQWVSK